MAQIVNLRQARKSQKRAKDRAQADANASRFGLTASERSRIDAEARLVDARLSGHRIERDGEPEDPAGSGT